MNRAVDAQPDAIDRWALPSLDLKYTGNGFSVVSSTSYFYRHTHDLEDSTYGTQQILNSYYKVTTLPNQPYLWDGERYHNQLTEEARLSFDPIYNFSGTVGVFLFQYPLAVLHSADLCERTGGGHREREQCGRRPAGRTT